MAVIDVDRLLQPLEGDSPTGADLEYDPEFGALDLAARARPEQQMGDAVISGEEPDWPEVRRRALSLLERTKDLRVAVILARALVHTDGIRGLADGLRLVDQMVEQWWEPLHPHLDPDDDLDPTLRLNILLELADADASLRPLRRAPIIETRAFGRVSLRDVDLATGQEEPVSEEKPPEPATIDAAFLECDLDDLQAASDAFEQAATRLRHLESQLTEQVGSGALPDLSPLEALLRRGREVVAERLGRRGVGEPAAGSPDAAAGDAPASAAAATGAAPAADGAIRGREDVIRLLDRICEFYRHNEPSSPVPLLLQRAKRLVSKDFLDILRDIAPDAVAQAEAVGGGGREES
jgi:type VI secretion system protein ImpA